MANFFDQFDADHPAPAKPNFFDQFDEGASANQHTPQNTGLLGDIGTDLKRGALKLPGAVAGIADIPVGIVTGERKVRQWADEVGEATGFQPGKWADEAAKEYSPQRQAGAAEIDKAWEDGGATDIAGAYLRNPGNVAGMVAESLPSMVAGGLAGRAAMSVAGLAGRSLSPVVAGAAGEAAVSAGQAMDQISDDVDARRAATAAAATGALTGAFGYAGGRAAQRLGLVDPESAIAGGAAATATDRPPRGLASRMLAGAMSEGAFEELPQSVQEQMWQNWAEGRDLSEGVARSAVEGTIAGGAMGATANVMPAGRSPEPDGGPSLTIEPEFGIDPDQRALPSPVSTGTPNEQVLQAEVERANEVAAAEARTAELYRQRSEVEAQRAGIDPQGGPLQKAAATALDQRVADLAAASQPADMEGPQRQPPVRERDYVPPPSGSFSTMDDLAELVGQERQDVDQRRAAIAETQAQRRDFEFEEADRRVAEQMQREAATRRRMVLDAVLEDPETANHTERFSATLKRFGFRDAMPTEDELATIRRFENVRAAQPAAPEVEASAPNELDAGTMGIRERRERQGRQVGEPAGGLQTESPPTVSGEGRAEPDLPPVRFSSPQAQRRAGLALPMPTEGGARRKADELTKGRGELHVVIPHPMRKGRFAVVPGASLAPPAADLSGPAINNRWTSFSVESGTLGIPRAEMPQIQAEHRGAMVNFLAARGVQSTQEEVAPESLRPTQAEFSPDKVRRAMGRRQGNRSILVSSDGYVLDGHHQWLAAREQGRAVPVIRLDAPIREVIALARQFPSSTTERVAAERPGEQDARVERVASVEERGGPVRQQESQQAAARPIAQGQGATGASRYSADSALSARAYRVADDLRAMTQDAGWAEEGGRLLRGADGTVSRTKWTPRAEWFAAGMETRPDVLARHLEEVLAGRGAPVKSRRTIEGMMDWLDSQRGAPVLDEDASIYDFEAAFDSVIDNPDARVVAEVFDEHVEGQSEADAMRALGFTDEEIANATGQAERGAGGVETPDAGRTTAPGERAGEAGRAQEEAGRDAAEGLLSSYTDDDLAQREAEQRAAADREAREQQDLERRAQADAERGAFTLTGSDRHADVQAAQGQGGLFDAPAATASPAPQDGTTNTEAQRAGIADFGEKLGGARKDRAAIEAMSRDFTDAELESLPLSKIWPADEIDKIEDTFSAAVAHAARSEIPAKPRTAYKARAWAQKVKTLRSLMQPLREGLPRERIEEAMRSMPTLDHFRAKVALLESIDRAHWKRIGEVREYPDAYRYGEGGEKVPTPSVSVTIDDKRQRFDGAKSVADVLDSVRERLGEGAGAKQMQFDVYQRRGEFFIAKAGDKEKRALKTFSSAKEALDYRKGSHADLVAAWEAVKDRDNVKKADVRRGENRDRVGRDWRGGKDVTPEQFISELGFRGVEFGNWVGQGKGAKERQGMLNQAYDALMDLAQVVGVPPRAISLDGTLGLGFGSRGAGWASAHFESDTLVINLTKTRGAGSLAHEWFHALDNYFARYRGAPAFSGNQAAYRRDAYITYSPENYYVHAKTGTRIAQRAFEVMIKGERHPDYGTLSPRFRERSQWELKEGVRPEVGEAFADLVQALNASPMAKRSALNDKAADGYWSRIIERGARAFEGFVIHKMALNGHQNDYLANVVPASDFKRDAGRYPYLLDNEMAPVAEAFDNLFATIQARETERGVALFSRTTTASRAGMTADALRQSFAARMPALSRAVDAMLRRGDAGKKGGAVVIDTADETEIARAFASKTGRKFDEVVQYFRSEDTGDIQGFYDPRSGITFLVGPNLTAESAPAVLLHEMTHSQQRADIDAKAMRLLADRDFMPMRRELLQFLDRVAARMDDAGETGNAREATAYIVEEAVLRGRNAGFSAVDGRFINWVDSTLGKRVGAIIRDFVAMARAWALRHGGMLRNPSVDDLVAVAVAGAKRAARGDVVTSGGTTMASTAAEALQAKTATPEFKEWFGTSKMVGKDGRPLVFLHGSPNAFDAFDNGRLGESSSHTSTGLGHFFTRNRSVAEKYADGGHIYRGWLRMQKPYVMSLAEAQGFDTSADAAKRRQALQKQGFDGAIVLDDTKKPWAFVVFEPWQFKSTDNRGTFDEFDDRFRFSRASVERAIRGVIDAARTPGHAPQKANLGGVSNWLASEAKARAGLNIEGFTHVLDGSAVRHMLNRHTNPTIEKNRGQIALTDADIAAAAEVVSAPDQVVLGTKTQGHKDQIAYLKRQADGSILYLEEVRTGRRELAAMSMRKYPAAKDFSDIVATLPSNARSDGGDGLIVVTPPDAGNLRFSRAGAASGSPPRSRNPSSITAAWDASEPSKLDNLLYTLQNKQIDMKRVVDAVKEKVGQIEDAWNPYLQEELFHGRSAKGVKDFLTHEMRPLLIEMRMANVSMADFERFLHARHAPEANAHIAKINPNEPDLQDGGSGMTNKEAADHLASIDPGRRKTFDRLAKRIDAINANTRKLLVDSGLETAETVKAWEAAYKHYVPLQREDAEAGGLGIGQGFSVRGSAAKRRTGSKKAVVDILANIAMQRERAITRAEKNRVAQANYALALKAPNPDFWMPVNPDEAKAWTPAQRQKIADELTRMGLDPTDAQNFAKEPVQRYVDPRTGLVSERINPVLRSADNVLAVRLDGQDRFVFFNRKDERAQRMVHALKNLDADQVGRMLQVSAKLTRWFAAVNTQYNPVFGIVNLTRDVQAALLQLSTTPIRGAEKEVLRNTMPAMRGIYAALRAERDGKAAPTDEWSQLFEEFQNEGGQTGYRDQFSSSQARADALRKELDPEGWMETPLGKVFTANGALKVPVAQAQKIAGGLFGWLTDYNDTLENSVRLAAYKAAKDQGMSRQQAASVAKNLTVNFNRKGQIATQAGAMYAFFNAAMQGTTRMVQTLRGPAGKKIVAGGLSLGVLQALTLAAAGFDDDDPPEFVRERSIVIPIGGGKYASIPMPLGFHVIPSTSRILTEWALSGFKDTTRRFGDFMALFADTFNPIGNAGWSMQTLAPTALDPLAALAENRDWTGKPIAQEDFNSLRPTPGHARAKDTASELSRVLSYWFNFASGGTDYKPGLISPTPDQIDYLIGQVTGGVGREYLKAEQTAMSVLTGEELPPHKIPLLGRFYGDTTGQSSESARFYNNLREINLHRAEVEGRRRDRGDVAGYLRENPSARLALGGPVAVENQVRKLRKAKEEAVEAGQSARVRLIEGQITTVMRKFNERVAALEE